MRDEFESWRREESEAAGGGRGMDRFRDALFQVVDELICLRLREWEQSLRGEVCDRLETIEELLEAMQHRGEK
jgi:hypothetical protein